MTEKFLNAGVAWDVISNATGITQEKLQELKQMLQEMVGNVAQKGATGGALSLQGGAE